jgi:hypothetical protein
MMQMMQMMQMMHRCILILVIMMHLRFFCGASLGRRPTRCSWS